LRHGWSCHCNLCIFCASQLWSLWDKPDWGWVTNLRQDAALQEDERVCLHFIAGRETIETVYRNTTAPPHRAIPASSYRLGPRLPPPYPLIPFLLRLTTRDRDDADIASTRQNCYIQSACFILSRHGNLRSPQNLPNNISYALIMKEVLTRTSSP